jgi:hypothetical protein
VVQANKEHEDLIQQQKINIVCWECVAVWWRPVDKGDYSSAFPGNGARKSSW